MFKVNAILATTTLTYRQVEHWCAKGWIHPVRNGVGSGVGNERIFFGAEFQRVRRIARLVNVGTSPSLASALANGSSVALGDRYRLVMVRTSR